MFLWLISTCGKQIIVFLQINFALWILRIALWSRKFDAIGILLRIIAFRFIFWVIDVCDGPPSELQFRVILRIMGCLRCFNSLNAIWMQESCPSVKNILLLDAEGKRVAVKYYSDDWPTNNAKEAFEKFIFAKTQKTNARTEGRLSASWYFLCVVWLYMCVIEFTGSNAHSSSTKYLCGVCCGISSSSQLVSFQWISFSLPCSLNNL